MTLFVTIESGELCAGRAVAVQSDLHAQSMKLGHEKMAKFHGNARELNMCSSIVKGSIGSCSERRVVRSVPVILVFTCLQRSPTPSLCSLLSAFLAVLCSRFSVLPSPYSPLFFSVLSSLFSLYASLLSRTLLHSIVCLFLSTSSQQFNTMSYVGQK